MEFLSNGFTLELCKGAFPLSTDSMALAGFVRLPKNASVLDLGSGCGTLGMLLCAQKDDCRITGIELDPDAHATALENAKRNNVCDRFTSICADLKTISTFIQPGSFTCCVSNPPYFRSGLRSKQAALARHEDACTMAHIMEAAAWALKYGGDFFLVHKPERLAELFSHAAANNLEPKRLCLLRHSADGPVALVLVQCRKGAKPGLVWEEMCLHNPDGSPTDQYRALYHL